MPYIPPPDLATLSLAQIAELAQARKLPPVTEWNPEKTGDSEMRITSDGRWFHQGGEITRPAMVRAFSSLLMCDDGGQHWLVTPYEKLSIKVDDAPFLAVEVRSEGAGQDRHVALRLNTDDLVLLNADHPIVMRDAPDGSKDPPLPYLLVRDQLWAKMSRALYYEIIEMAIAEHPQSPGLWSGGTHFSFGPSS